MVIKECLTNSSSFQNALYLIRIVGTPPGSTLSELSTVFSASTPTAKRLIKLARELGADIEASKTKDGYRYRVTNLDAIQESVDDLLKCYRIISTFEDNHKNGPKPLIMIDSDNLVIKLIAELKS